MQDKFAQYFKDVEDPRSTRNQHHPLITLIGTTFLSFLSGIDSFSGIQDFVESHFEELSKYFDSPMVLRVTIRINDYGIPYLLINFNCHFKNLLKPLRKSLARLLVLMEKQFAIVGERNLFILSQLGVRPINWF